MLINGRVNQKVEERSQLIFEFNSKNETVLRILPFFENVKLTESKRANYIKYNLIGRSTPLYNYFNSESRSFDLEFNITLPHIVENYTKNLLTLTIPTERANVKLTRQAFFEIINKHEGYLNAKEEYGNDDSNYLFRNPIYDANTASKEHRAFTDTEKPNNFLDIERRKVIDVVMYWINLIRSSTVNNSTNVLEGPPIIRIRHGIMFQDISTVCFSYNIDKDEEAGYDAETLLPRRINVGLQLVEIKQGNFSKYQQSVPISRDNLKGWESIIEKGGSMSLDPIRL